MTDAKAKAGSSDAAMVPATDSDAIARTNAKAWDREGTKGHWASIPLSEEKFRDAKERGFPISLTGSRNLPEAWLDDVNGRQLLCIACGGGQQAVLFAARGAQVTSLENSEKQLESDVDTCRRFGLPLTPVKGSMDQLPLGSVPTFDMIILGMGAQFVADLRPVFAQARRLMKPKARFIGAFVNPVCYIFDWKAQEEGNLVPRHKVPYSDLTSLSADERLQTFGEDAPLEFGHSFEEIIGGMSAAGFCIRGYIEEFDEGEEIGKYFPSYCAMYAEPA